MTLPKTRPLFVEIESTGLVILYLATSESATGNTRCCYYQPTTFSMDSFRYMNKPHLDISTVLKGIFKGR